MGNEADLQNREALFPRRVAFDIPRECLRSGNCENAFVQPKWRQCISKALIDLNDGTPRDPKDISEPPPRCGQFVCGFQN
jgi:hypothetical protein